MRLGSVLASLAAHAVALGALWVAHRPVCATDSGVPIELPEFTWVEEMSSAPTHAPVPEPTPPEEPTPESEPEPELMHEPEPEIPAEIAVAPAPESPSLAPKAESPADAAETHADEERAHLVAAPRALHRISPRYPRAARLKRREGSVTVEFAVGANGRVTSASVVASSGSRDLDAAALESVRKAAFAPATEDGVPVDANLRLTLEFRLK